MKGPCGRFTYDSMTKCKAIKSNYLPCEKEALTIGLCGTHRNQLATETAKEEARLADNMSALMKAADKRSKTFALMTITQTPGTEKEYAEAKQEETTLKTRVAAENERHQIELMAQKCCEVAARKLHEMLNLESNTSPTCYVTTGVVHCTQAGSPHDHLCDKHRSLLIDAILVLSRNAHTPITPNNLSFHLNSDLNNQLLFDAFREAISAARVVRFGAQTAAPPPMPTAIQAPRRVAPSPALTAPVDVAPHVARQHLEMSLALSKPITCPICYDNVTAETIVMTHCGHVYCTPCLTAARQRERKCPQCRVVI